MDVVAAEEGATQAITRATQMDVTHRQVTLARWDDFNRPDGRLDASNGGRLPSGQKWNLDFSTTSGSTGVASDLLIVNKRLRFDKPGASYLWTTGPVSDPTQSIMGHAVEFCFDPGTTFAASVGLICSQKQTAFATGVVGVATNSVHFSITPLGWSVGIFDGVTLLSVMSSGTFATPLVCDGVTRYRCAIHRTDIDRIEIEIPTPDLSTQVTRPVQDSRIPAYWGSSSLTEHFNPAATFSTDARPIITGYGVKGPWTSLASQFANYVPLAQLAAAPDQMATGTITRSATGAATSFAVAWPDGATGTFTGTESTSFPGAIDAYTLTHTLSGTTHTYTQAALTRDASGNVTNRPAITVV